MTIIPGSPGFPKNFEYWNPWTRLRGHNTGAYQMPTLQDLQNSSSVLRETVEGWMNHLFHHANEVPSEHMADAVEKIQTAIGHVKDVLTVVAQPVAPPAPTVPPTPLPSSEPTGDSSETSPVDSQVTADQLNAAELAQIQGGGNEQSS